MKKVKGKIAGLVAGCPLSLFILLSICTVLLAMTLTGCKSENGPDGPSEPVSSGTVSTQPEETDDPNDPSYDNKIRILKKEIESELSRINSEEVARTEELKAEEDKYNRNEEGNYPLMNLDTLYTEFAQEVARCQTALGVEPDEWGPNPLYALGLRGTMPGYTGISTSGNGNTYQNGSWIDCDWLHQDDAYAEYTWEALPVYEEMQTWLPEILWLCKDKDGDIIAMAQGVMTKDDKFEGTPQGPDYEGLRWYDLYYSYLGLEHMKLYPDRERNTWYTDTWRNPWSGDYVVEHEPLLHEFD